MGPIKHMPKKLRMIAAGRKHGAPRWADLKKYGHRARSRRIRVQETKHWRRGRLMR